MPLLTFLKKRGNVAALADWVGKVGFKGALKHVAKHVTGGDVERAKKVTGKLKGMAHKRGTLAPEHAYGKTAKSGAADGIGGLPRASELASEKVKRGFLKDGAEGASGTPPGSPPTTPGDKPGREAATHAELAKPPVKGEHFEPDEDQVGGAPEGDKDDKKLGKSGGPECGPKPIGTTRSGKQVFGIPSHSGHWKYDAADHDDAARIHEEAGRMTEATIHRHKAQKLRANGHDAFAKGEEMGTVKSIVASALERDSFTKAMTKRHFEDAAAYMREQQSKLSPEEHSRHLDTLSSVFRGQNPRFDEGRFRGASGEGSRGGIVTGHTPRGKARYQGGRARALTGASKKHFEAAAAYMREQQSKLSPEEHARHVDTLVNTFRGTNPRFDEDKFRRASGQPGYGTPEKRYQSKPKPKPAPEKGPYQPKTGEACSCKPGLERDNCPHCEGTGQKIDFAAIRARHTQKARAFDWSGRPVALLKAKGEGSRGGRIIGHTKSGKAIYEPGHESYTTPQRMPKWNVKPTARMEHTVARRQGHFRDWSKDDHLEAARKHADERNRHNKAHGELADKALKEHGSQGSLISGVVRDHFPTATKNKLRHHAHSASAHGEASHMHYKLAGKRNPYGTSDFAKALHG